MKFEGMKKDILFMAFFNRPVSVMRKWRDAFTDFSRSSKNKDKAKKKKNKFNHQLDETRKM